MKQNRLEREMEKGNTLKVLKLFNQYKENFESLESFYLEERNRYESIKSNYLAYLKEKEEK